MSPNERHAEFSPGPTLIDLMIVLVICSAITIFVFWVATRFIGVNLFEELPAFIVGTYGYFTALGTGSVGLGAAVIQSIRRSGPRPDYVKLVGVCELGIIALIVLIVLADHFVIRKPISAPTPATVPSPTPASSAPVKSAPLTKTELIFLNAVRASQRIPMSFPDYDDLPREPIRRDLVGSFANLGFPRELVELMVIASFEMKANEYAQLKKQADAVCAKFPDSRTAELCQLVAQGTEDLAVADCPVIADSRVIVIANIARDFCSWTRFQTFSRITNLLNAQAPVRLRSPNEIMYFLGDLIFAQNFAQRPYLPLVLIAVPRGRLLVPLFDVRRGTPALDEAALVVKDDGGQTFYIPKPKIGAVDEARSMQVLDLVSQTIPNLKKSSNSVEK